MWELDMVLESASEDMSVYSRWQRSLTKGNQGRGRCKRPRYTATTQKNDVYG